MNCNCIRGIADIREGICNARKGLACLCEALQSLQCCQLCEAQQLLNNAICLIKEAICQLERGLCQAENNLNCQEVRDIREGICCLRKGLEEACRALNALCCRRLCEAAESLESAACLIQKGICKVEQALENI
ncbi:hypothetical protein Ami103574_12875 [Aminipila butyrica]|uniref:Uncharacterized protein n=1 Tax=Aminipila butyrica TaxID=433296 RepID=A0A858BYD4_9FIRM|nr:hypothetical protein [Aminipila butyrica]QIB70128.1 hypothetical protein Ami103574_12875 [Aminipila butyrica]